MAGNWDDNDDDHDNNNDDDHEANGPYESLIVSCFIITLFTENKLLLLGEFW